MARSCEYAKRVRSEEIRGGEGKRDRELVVSTVGSFERSEVLRSVELSRPLPDHARYKCIHASFAVSSIGRPPHPYSKLLSQLEYQLQVMARAIKLTPFASDHTH